MSLCEAAGMSTGSPLQRIADICLFILGMFPEYASATTLSPVRADQTPDPRKERLSPEAYEKEGRKFYKLAAEHRSSKELNLSDIFGPFMGISKGQESR